MKTRFASDPDGATQALAPLHGYVGRSIPRVEDPLLVTGRAEFIDNVSMPGLLHCAILRSPHAHARIVRIDASAAASLPGVEAVITGEDALRWASPAATVPAGWGTLCLAPDRVRFVGEPVAAVAATSRALAEDAIEMIAVDYERLPAVMDPREAVRPDCQAIFPEKGSNVVYQRAFEWGDVGGAFRDADRVVRESFRFHRAGANAIETFGVIAHWNPQDDSLTCHGSFQSPAHIALGRLASLRLAPGKLRLVPYPHGGSFGGKNGGRGTDIAALLSRKSGGRPVKWIEDRTEYLLAGSSQAWDRHYDVALAVKRDGTITGFAVELLDDLGANAEGFGTISAVRPLACFTGNYAIPAASYDLTVVATNKLPASPYRGMGVPPHTAVLEMMLDLAACELGLDPAEIRRRNFIARDCFPYTIPSGNEYDSGDYQGAQERALALADYAGLRRQQAEARREGRLFGVGIVSSIEPGVFDWNLYSLVGVPAERVPEGVTLSVEDDGSLGVKVGFGLEGQGHHTIAAQVLADRFGVGPGDVRIEAQDTLTAPRHFGPGGNHLGVALTGALLGASDLLEGRLVRAAAGMLAAEPAAIELAMGRLRRRDDPGVGRSLAEVARAMRLQASGESAGEASPEVSFVWAAPDRGAVDEHGRVKSYLTAANACHVVAVEIERETGRVQILRYVLVDDCGTRLNPGNVEGMIDGGFVQGIGMALFEEYAYDAEGQPLTTTLMDYLLPTIDDVPATGKAALVTPSPFTPYGAKGVGEAAIHATPAAILCAVNDALAPLAVKATEVPLGPERLWRIVRDAQTALAPAAGW